MKTTANASLRMMLALAAGAIAGCAASPGQPHGAHHAGLASASVPPSGPFYAQGASAGGTTASGGMPDSDKGAMCAMHRDMAQATNEDARRAMIERRLQGMSPEQRLHHMEMMRRHCH